MSLGTVDEHKPTSNALEQLGSAATKLLGSFPLADTHTLLLGQIFWSLVDGPLAHPLDCLGQLRPRRGTSVCGVGVLPDHARQVVAVEMVELV